MAVNHSHDVANLMIDDVAAVVLEVFPGVGATHPSLVVDDGVAVDGAGHFAYGVDWVTQLVDSVRERQDNVDVWVFGDRA
jgi:hypothetical protein